MSTIGVRSEGTESSGSGLDMHLEVVVLPVSDVDRAKEFYGRLGWRLDADVAAGDEFRLVQFTPPGSGCSIQFGINLSSASPGSLQSLYLTVSDVEAAREELTERGIEVSEVFHEGAGGARFHDPGRVAGRSPDTGNSYKSFANVQRFGRQWLALPGSHDPAARPHRRRGDVICVGERFGGRSPPGVRRAR
jgi:catechol 2,3-dioxygenase-like lactoylglutathione lyase family enzyme